MSLGFEERSLLVGTAFAFTLYVLPWQLRCSLTFRGKRLDVDWASVLQLSRRIRTYFWSTEFGQDIYPELRNGRGDPIFTCFRQFPWQNTRKVMRNVDWPIADERGVPSRKVIDPLRPMNQPVGSSRPNPTEGQGMV